MTFYSRVEAIDRLNRFGYEKAPFLFAIDFSGERAYVEKLEGISADRVRYDFPSASNMSDAPVRELFHWQITPPPKREYRQSFQKVRDHLLQGDSFLANLTVRIPLDTDLTLEEIARRAKAPYRLWIRGHFACFSPEPFLRIREGVISGFPMKGTIRADLPHAEQRLLEDRKEAAEHATVTDLIRNDLSKIADRVRVRRYRYVESIRTRRGTILQTSSEIAGILPPDYRDRFGDLLFSQLPAGSITGAPKEKTVEIIRQAEGYERGFYTGVMGICQDGNLESAVMIRMVCQEDGKLYFKAGGGITAQSDWEKEYDEIICKSEMPIH